MIITFVYRHYRNFTGGNGIMLPYYLIYNSNAIINIDTIFVLKPIKTM